MSGPAWFARAAARIAKRRFSLNQAGQEDVRASVEAICRDAERRRGRLGGIAAGVIECASLLVARRSRALSERASQQSERSWVSRAARCVSHDITTAVRAILRAPAAAALVMLTIALGVGVNTAVFSVLDAALLRPVPYRDADRLVNFVNYDPKQGFSYAGFPPEFLEQWKQQPDLFASVNAWSSASLVQQRDDGSVLVNGASVTPGLFDMLGVAAERGRTFGAGDGRTGTERRVVISHRFWRDALGGRPDVLGAVLTLNDVRCDVIGVMPASFQYPNALADIWLPYDTAAPPAAPTASAGVLMAVARLAPGVPFARAATEAMARGNRLSRAAGLPGDTVTVQLSRPADIQDPKAARSLLALGGAAAFLLLMVAANLANLSLGQALARYRDAAVRAALGASRADLVREAAAESTIVGMVGTVGGLGVAWLLQRATLSALPDSFVTSSSNAVDMDDRAIACGVFAGVVAAVAFGVPRITLAIRGRVAEGLRAESRGSTSGRGIRRWQSALVLIEVSLSVVLLVGAALLAHSVKKLYDEPRGFDTTGLLSMTIAMPASTYPTAAARTAFAEAVVETLRRQPGVTGATMGGVPADRLGVVAGTLETSAGPTAPGPMSLIPAREVPPGYFDMLRVPVIDGRTFQRGDADTDVIVSDALAKRYWPTRSAVGERFRFAGGPSGGPTAAWRTIVGVVGTVRVLNEARDSGSAIYYSMGHSGGLLTALRPASMMSGFATIVVRVDQPAAFVRPMTSLVHAADARAVVWKTDFVDHLYADAFARPRVVFLAVGAFAGLGLILMAAGLYGVLAHMVGRRMRELGVRSALGATRVQLARVVAVQAFGLTVVGGVVGLACAVPLVRLMRAVLYDVAPTDPWSLSIVTLVLGAAALAAAWRPARRAMRADPIALLRQD